MHLKSRCFLKSVHQEAAQDGVELLALNSKVNAVLNRIFKRSMKKKWYHRKININENVANSLSFSMMASDLSWDL